ncbi:hypothetical protein COJ42_27250 [Bacillus cereus]|nr:hypothetical protein CN464_27135 [Bacillus cereus]PFM26694.1 hypothetical protein COJ42_27250 [Bacillus cereus]PFP83556.1 hypothetical protein COK02_29300 [Bacillus cereus]PGN46880.1 hypothetical protein CN966_31565 [Bacillus cereus]
MQQLQIHIYQKHPKVNFSIEVYICSLDFIGFIATYPFSSKMTRKVYIQNTVNKQVTGTHY